MRTKDAPTSKQRQISHSVFRRTVAFFFAVDNLLHRTEPVSITEGIDAKAIGLIVHLIDVADIARILLVLVPTVSQMPPRIR